MTPDQWIDAAGKIGVPAVMCFVMGRWAMRRADRLLDTLEDTQKKIPPQLDRIEANAGCHYPDGRPYPRIARGTEGS